MNATLLVALATVITTIATVAPQSQLFLTIICQVDSTAVNLMAKSSLAYWGYILALVGGILMLLLGGLAFLGLAFSFPFRSPLRDLDLLGRDFITIILGIIAIFGSTQVRRLEWSIVLIIVGILGGDIGGLLVLVGGILGLISYSVKHA